MNAFFAALRLCVRSSEFHSREEDDRRALVALRSNHPRLSPFLRDFLAWSKWRFHSTRIAAGACDASCLHASVACGVPGTPPTSTVRSSDWPKSPRALSVKVRQLAPQLRSIGIDLEFRREMNGRFVTSPWRQKGTNSRTFAGARSSTTDSEFTSTKKTAASANRSNHRIGFDPHNATRAMTQTETACRRVLAASRFASCAQALCRQRFIPPHDAMSQMTQNRRPFRPRRWRRASDVLPGRIAVEAVEGRCPGIDEKTSVRRVGKRNDAAHRNGIQKSRAVSSCKKATKMPALRVSRPAAYLKLERAVLALAVFPGKAVATIEKSPLTPRQFGGGDVGGGKRPRERRELVYRLRHGTGPIPVHRAVAGWLCTQKGLAQAISPSS